MPATLVWSRRLISLCGTKSEFVFRSHVVCVYFGDTRQEGLKAQIQLWSDPEKPDDYDPYNAAGNYSMLGDKENAFLWLDKAYAVNDKLGGGNLLEIQVYPFLDNIRSDPRYKALLRRMRFPQ